MAARPSFSVVISLIILFTQWLLQACSTHSHSSALRVIQKIPQIFRLTVEAKLPKNKSELVVLFDPALQLLVGQTNNNNKH